MTTEDVSPRYMDLDAWPLGDALDAMLEGQMSAVAAIRPALPAIALAVDEAAESLRRGGRLVYAGAGTSGRVAVQDGAELPPTFSWPHQRLVFLMAGGRDALIASSENAEDDGPTAIHLVDDAMLTSIDVLIAVAASGTTPFTVAAAKRAGERGAITIGIANNPHTPLLDAVRHPILIETGSELIAGSTRMKAGTAQKIVLNMISSMVMVRLGRVYRGMMVDMRPANAKLRRRAEDMVERITGCDHNEAIGALEAADADVKLASLIAIGFAPGTARDLLSRNGGNLRDALADAGQQG